MQTPADVWEGARHHSSRERCTLKPPGETLSHLPEGPSSVNRQTPSAGGVWREGGPALCWWEFGRVQPLRKAVRRRLKQLQMDLPFDPAIPLLGACSQKPKTLTRKNAAPLRSSQPHLQPPRPGVAFVLPCQGVTERGAPTRGPSRAETGECSGAERDSCTRTPPGVGVACAPGPAAGGGQPARPPTVTSAWTMTHRDGRLTLVPPPVVPKPTWPQLPLSSPSPTASPLCPPPVLWLSSGRW